MTGNQLHPFSSDLNIPADWLQIKTIDMHTGGEPLRVVLSGLPGIEGNSILECRADMKKNHDVLRKILMWEPRGHADMYGAVVLRPFSEKSDFSVLFMHNEGYSTMCGHAVIGLTKLAVDMGWVKGSKVVIDAPCGLIRGEYNKSSKLVSFEGVPSFVISLNNRVDILNGQTIIYDLAYGGAFYAYVNSKQTGISLEPQNTRRLIDLGMEIKHSVIRTNNSILHPMENDLSFLYGTIFIEQGANNSSRNVCVFADGEVDRSPTGSGVMGRLAIHYANKEIQVGEEIKVESIIGSVFRGRVIRELEYGKYNAIIPGVRGEAYVTGQHTFVIDPEDPFKDGFLLK